MADSGGGGLDPGLAQVLASIVMGVASVVVARIGRRKHRNGNGKDREE